MSSYNGAGNNSPSAATFDTLLLQSLMGRLQLRPPYLDTNSFLSQSLDEFLLGELPHELGADEDDDEDDDQQGAGRTELAKEEAKLEKEIIRIVHSGTATEQLKPNSGQSVAIGEHHVCVGFHEEPGSEYRVWEWHGHIALFDEENGYSAEYIYGNYFERLQKVPGRKSVTREEVEDEEDDECLSNPGLKDLIGEEKDSRASGGRVIHRNSLHSGSSK